MIQGAFEWMLGAGGEAALLIVSMLPLIELRGAVPLGLAVGLPWFEVLPLCYAGNLLPIPFVMIFGLRLLNWLETLRPFSKLTANYKKRLMVKSAGITKYAYMGLLLFVAIPLPGTGAWSGAVIATLLNLPMRKAFISIALGVIIAGLVMVVGTHSVLGVAGI